MYRTRSIGRVEQVTIWARYSHARPAKCGTHIHAKVPAPMGNKWLITHRAGFILPFGPETSGSKEDSVSREDLRVERKGFTLKGI